MKLYMQGRQYDSYYFLKSQSLIVNDLFEDTMMHLPFSLTTVALLILSCTAANPGNQSPRRVPRAILCANPSGETHSLNHSPPSNVRILLHL